MADALALEAEEGREKHRYAVGSSKMLWSSDFRMGEPSSSKWLLSYHEYIVIERVTRRTETS